MDKILLFNPRSARYNFRIPNSILQVAASIEGKFKYAIVDGNLEKDPWEKIRSYLQTSEFKYFGCTVMPGPQLEQAIPITKSIRQEFPEIINIWGGYFASNQYKSVIESDWVDFIVDGPGDNAFPKLIQSLNSGETALIKGIGNLIYKENGKIIKSPKESIPEQDDLPAFPYQVLDQYYNIEKYLRKSHLGNKTIAYHSSFGCPFTCSFCAVVPIYNARWKGKSATKIYSDIKHLKDNYGGDAIEFHDNNFFVSEKRVSEFSDLIKGEKMNWWGEGRIDTLDKYSDNTLAKMREAGCKMIFLGAESGNDEILSKMNKGGKQNSKQMKNFALRMKKFDIIPEYSFVLGLPGENENQVMNQINAEIQFIKELKSLNPDLEVIIYVYSPVPTEGSELFDQVKESGFFYPQNLEDWLNPEWLNFDLRKNPLTPWLKPRMINKISDFETVLNAQYPTVSDIKISDFQRRIMQYFSFLRYKFNIYAMPYELKFLQKFWLKYRQPEIEGFYLE